MIPYESTKAGQLNAQVFKHIKDEAYKASIELGKLKGNAPIFDGLDYGRRNTTLTAVAPTTSSAFILGQVSQSIEPIWSNTYVKDVAKLKVTIRNTKLEEILEELGKNNRETWNSIRDNDGSVQHLDFLTDLQKEVFKTFKELDQTIVIDQAAVRQNFIDQSQSLNIMTSADLSAKDINRLYIFAWENGVKSLYYQHSTNAAQQFSLDKVCLSCEA